MIDPRIHNVICMPVSKYGFTLKKDENKGASKRRLEKRCGSVSEAKLRKVRV